jgi:hypothetical protein
MLFFKMPSGGKMPRCQNPPNHGARGVLRMLAISRQTNHFGQISWTLSGDVAKSEENVALLVDKHAEAHKLHGLPEKGWNEFAWPFGGVNNSNTVVILRGING